MLLAISCYVYDLSRENVFESPNRVAKLGPNQISHQSRIYLQGLKENKSTKNGSLNPA